MKKTIWKPIVLAVAVAYLGFASFVWWAMHQPPEAFGRVMSRLPGLAYPMVPFETMWTHARAGALTPGDLAPDFTLAKLEDKTGRLQLASLTSRQPVVLIFGSYT